MMKKWVCFVLVLLLCIGLTGCSDEKTPHTNVDEPTSVTTTPTSDVSLENDASVSDSSDEAENLKGSTPLFYKATDQDGDIVWLLGSIHVGNENMYPLPDAVMTAFDSAEALAVESNVVAYENDPETSQWFLQSMVYEDGSTIKDHLSQEVYDALVALLTKEGMYYKELDYIKACEMSSLLSQILIERTDYNFLDGIDRFFIHRAMEEDKPILDVEEFEYHFTITSRFSDELNEFLLKNDIESFDDPQTITELEDMVNIWRKGNEAEFEAYLASEDDDMETPQERRLYEEYNNIMIVERNILMTDYAEQALKNGNELFICVGAAHVVGDGGIVDLLTERGYTVELIR